MQLGGALGLALTSVIATTEREKALGRGMEYIDALHKGISSSFWLSAALNFTACIIALFILRGIGIVGGHGKGGKPGAPGGSGAPGGPGKPEVAAPPNQSADERVEETEKEKEVRKEQV